MPYSSSRFSGPFDLFILLKLLLFVLVLGAAFVYLVDHPNLFTAVIVILAAGTVLVVLHIVSTVLREQYASHWGPPRSVAATVTRKWSDEHDYMLPSGRAGLVGPTVYEDWNFWVAFDVGDGREEEFRVSGVGVHGGGGGSVGPAHVSGRATSALHSFRHGSDFAGGNPPAGADRSAWAAKLKAQVGSTSDSRPPGPLRGAGGKGALRARAPAKAAAVAGELIHVDFLRGGAEAERAELAEAHAGAAAGAEIRVGGRDIFGAEHHFHVVHDGGLHRAAVGPVAVAEAADEGGLEGPYGMAAAFLLMLAEVLQGLFGSHHLVLVHIGPGQEAVIHLAQDLC